LVGVKSHLVTFIITRIQIVIIENLLAMMALSKRVFILSIHIRNHSFNVLGFYRFIIEFCGFNIYRHHFWNL